MRWMIAALVLAGCAVDDMPGPSEGRMLFAENCAQCHGSDARGAGDWVPELGRAPPDLTTLYARGFDRARVLSAIDGYEQAPVEGRVMPEWGLLMFGPAVPVEVDGRLTPVPRSLAALMFYLEEVQR